MSDDYEPAIEMQPDQPAAAASAAPARGGDDDPRVEGQPLDSTSEHRGQRTISDKTRAMFRDLTAKLRSGEVTLETDDLVPMTHGDQPAAPAVSVAQPPALAQPPAPPAAAQPRLVPPSASPASQAAAALPSLATLLARQPASSAADQPPGQPSAAEQQRIRDIEERERKVAAREAELAAAAPAPSAPRGRLVDAPAKTLVEYVQTEYGITDPDELKVTLRDLMTEIGVAHLDVKLPDEVKAGLESRNALRKVRAYTSDLDRKRAEVAARETEAQKAAREAQERAAVQEQDRQATATVASLVAQTADYPLLREQGEYGASIVWEAMKALHDQGQPSTFADAARIVEDHLRSEANALVQRAARYQSLLAPAAPAAPAQPAVSPGGAPGPAPTQPAPASARPQPTTPASTPQADEEIVGEDRRERRRRGLRGIAAKHGFSRQSS